MYKSAMEIFNKYMNDNFDYDIAIESTTFRYDPSDDYSLERYNVSIQDLEHSLKMHKIPTFANIGRDKKSKYVSYFSKYYQRHLDNLLDIINDTIHSQSKNLIDLINNSTTDNIVFTQKFSHVIGDVTNVETYVKKDSKLLLICLGVDRSASKIYFKSAYPVIPESLM